MLVIRQMMPNLNP